MDYETLRNSMTVQDAARVLMETNCYGTMDIAKNVILKALDGKVSSSEKLNEWIPISKETPEENGYYLTTTMFNQVYCDYWNGVAFERSETVIAWMPKPAPYKLQERDYESCDEIWEKAYAERDGKK